MPIEYGCSDLSLPLYPADYGAPLWPFSDFSLPSYPADYGTPIWPFVDFSLTPFVWNPGWPPLGFADFALKRHSRIQTTGEITGGNIVGSIGALSPYNQPDDVPYKIIGVSRSGTGAIMPNCVVRLYSKLSYGVVQEKVSDGSGNYIFYVQDDVTEYFVMAYKAGTPNRFGRTDHLLGVAV